MWVNSLAEEYGGVTIADDVPLLRDSNPGRTCCLHGSISPSNLPLLRTNHHLNVLLTSPLSLGTKIWQSLGSTNVYSDRLHIPPGPRHRHRMKYKSTFHPLLRVGVVQHSEVVLTVVRTDRDSSLAIRSKLRLLPASSFYVDSVSGSFPRHSCRQCHCQSRRWLWFRPPIMIRTRVLPGSTRSATAPYTDAFVRVDKILAVTRFAL